jgi:biotin transport system substrate-specific component
MQLAFQYIRNSRVLLTVIGAGLLCLCTQVNIPLHPVHISLQTVAVLIIGLTFSKADALRSVASYLALGAMGAPVFSYYSGGIAKLMGPTGGYLFGFLAAVWVMCTLRERVANMGTKETFLIALVGSAIVFLCGMPWLSTFVGWNAAITVGLVPFILPGIVKSVLVAAAVRYLKK